MPYVFGEIEGRDENGAGTFGGIMLFDPVLSSAQASSGLAERFPAGGFRSSLSILPPQ